jgi:hypothetical protein
MAPQDEPGRPKGAKGLGGMAGSSKGKVLIGAVLLLAVIAAAVAVFLLFGQGQSADEDSVRGLTTPNAAASDTSTAASPAPAAQSAQAPAEVPLDEVFTFRDIFVPLVKPASNPQSSDTASGTPAGTPATSDGTILLQDITVENGEPTAVLVWNGTSYSVQEGDQVGDSPWRVLEIRDDSVVMLYGDTQVVLSVGQAISK